MAVYGRTYRAYAGALTPERSRLWVIPRYALKDLFNSKLFLAFFVLCFVAPLIASIRIYLAHNTEAINILRLPGDIINRLFAIEPAFFRNWVMAPQSFMAFFVAMIVGPALISPDLRNNAMPLYLGRPITRRDYVLGKLIVLVVLLSAVTWVPGLALFLLQCFLQGFGWFADNFWLAGSIVVSSAVWILALSLVALAVSATVKWKPVARLFFFAAPLVLQALGVVLNLSFRTESASVLQVGDLLRSLWAGLFRLPLTAGLPSPVTAWVAFALVCALSVAVLARRIRAYEVER